MPQPYRPQPVVHLFGEPARTERVLLLGDDGDPDYRMDLTLSVQSGTMDVFASTADGGREGGEVSPESPIRIQAIVPASDEDVSVDLAVKGGEEAEVGGLAYEAKFTEAQ